MDTDHHASDAATTQHGSSAAETSSSAPVSGTPSSTAIVPETSAAAQGDELNITQAAELQAMITHFSRMLEALLANGDAATRSAHTMMTVCDCSTIQSINQA